MNTKTSLSHMFIQFLINKKKIHKNRYILLEYCVKSTRQKVRKIGWLEY